ADDHAQLTFEVDVFTLRGIDDRLVEANDGRTRLHEQHRQVRHRLTDLVRMRLVVVAEAENPRLTDRCQDSYGAQPVALPAWTQPVERRSGQTSDARVVGHDAVVHGSVESIAHNAIR